MALVGGSSATSAHNRSSWRLPRERAALRPFQQACRVDEAALKAGVKPLLKKQEDVLREKQRHMPHTEALQATCMQFNEEMARRCMAATAERDRRVVEAVRRHGRAALIAFQQLGVIEPPWLDVRHGKWQHALDDFAASLDETRAQRERCSA